MFIMALDGKCIIDFTDMSLVVCEAARNYLARLVDKVTRKNVKTEIKIANKLARIQK